MQYQDTLFEHPDIFDVETKLWCCYTPNNLDLYLACAKKRDVCHVYSNSKYLADFQQGMDQGKCEHYCNNWATECQIACKDSQACALSDNVNARFFTRDVSCMKTCVGFNMHEDG